MIARITLAVTLAALGCLVDAPSLVAQQVLVKPYVQPGNGSTLEGTDVKVLCWITDPTPGEFRVEFTLPDGTKRIALPRYVALDFAAPPPKPEPVKEEKKPGDEKPAEGQSPAKADAPLDEDEAHEKAEKEEAARQERLALEQHYYKYSVTLDQLPFDAEVRYRVKLGDAVVREDAFRTRASYDRPFRFALVGDMAQGKSAQNAIAYQIAQADPEFLLALGDIVYPSGTVSQYRKHFWPTYNDVAKASVKTGAPLMASVPVYPVLGNHDVAARLAQSPDALGVYYFFHPPQNGPGWGAWNTQLNVDDAAATAFKAKTTESYPSIDAYSFDYGSLHVLVLNSNRMKQLDSPKLREWVEADLSRTKGAWKLVCYHHPMFQSSTDHYGEQTLRMWQPLWEQYEVDLVFAGHVHNYQRGVPLKFLDPQPGEKQLVNGTFVLDREFDGQTKTKPNGVIHYVAGGGGASLYAVNDEKIAKLKKEYGDNYADYTAKAVSDRHSLVVIDVTTQRITIRALDGEGKELDKIAVDQRDEAATPTTSEPAVGQ